MSMYGLKSIPLEAQCLYRQGQELWSQGRHEAAVRCFRQAVIISPRFTRAYRELLDCLTLIGRRECVPEYNLMIFRAESTIPVSPMVSDA